MKRLVLLLLIILPGILTSQQTCNIFGPLKIQYGGSYSTNSLLGDSSKFLTNKTFFAFDKQVRIQGDYAVKRSELGDTSQVLRGLIESGATLTDGVFKASGSTYTYYPDSVGTGSTGGFYKFGNDQYPTKNVTYAINGNITPRALLIRSNEDNSALIYLNGLETFSSYPLVGIYNGGRSSQGIYITNNYNINGPSKRGIVIDNSAWIGLQINNNNSNNTSYSGIEVNANSASNGIYIRGDSTGSLIYLNQSGTGKLISSANFNVASNGNISTGTTHKYTIGGTLKDFYTDVSTSGTSQTNLYTYTLPANTLVNNGDKLVIFYSLTSNSTSGTIIPYFGTHNLPGITTLANNAYYSLELYICKTSSSSFRLTYRYISSSATDIYGVFTGDATDTDFTDSNIIKITGQADSGSITAKYGLIEFKPAGIN